MNTLEKILELLEKLTNADDAKIVMGRSQSKYLKLAMAKDPSVRERLSQSGKKGMETRWKNNQKKYE